MVKVLDTSWSVLPPWLKSEVRKGCLILVLLIFWDGEIGLCPLPSAAAMRCGSVHGASLIRVCLHSENGKQAERLMSGGPGECRTFACCPWKPGLCLRKTGGKQAARQSGRELARKALKQSSLHLINMRCVLAQLLGNCWSNYIQTSILKLEKGSAHNWQEEKRKEMA